MAQLYERKSKEDKPVWLSAMILIKPYLQMICKLRDTSNQ